MQYMFKLGTINIQYNGMACSQLCEGLNNQGMLFHCEYFDSDLAICKVDETPAKQVRRCVGCLQIEQRAKKRVIQ